MPVKLHAGGQVGDEVGDIVRRDEGAERSTAESYSHRITSLEALLEAASTDLEQWEVERHVVNKWEVGAKHPKTGQILVSPLWQVKAWLRPKVRQVVDEWAEAMQSLRRDLRGLRIPRQRARAVPRGGERYALELCLFDVHLGKLAWDPETGGGNWDVRITESAFLDAVRSHLAWWKGRPLELIIFPFGNDFFQVDTLQNSTTAGTIVDVDTRPSRTIRIGCRLMFQAVEMMRRVAPVHLVPVAGNHDEQRTLWLAEVLAAAYRGDKRVSLDPSAESVKCVEYGTSLIGYAHGKNERPVALMQEMPRRWPEAWARTTHHEWHTGHFHKKQSLLVEGSEEHQIRHRVIPSLCAADAYHAQALFYSQRASESHLWSREHGYRGHASFPPALCG